MKNKKIIKILFFAIIFLCLFAEAGLIIAQDTGGLEIKYPTTSTGVTPPHSIQTYLPRYIRYIYHFSVITGGLIAFLAVIYGGFRFLTSAGNPSATKDAREQILAGFLGLIIILGSFIILNEINPDLTSMKPPLPNYVMRKGIIVYTDRNSTPGLCGGLSNSEAAYPELVETLDGVYYKALSASGETILGTDENGNDILPDSLHTFHDSSLFRIEYYGNAACEGNAIGKAEEPFSAGDCIQINQTNVQCIKLIWMTPGVWVFNQLDKRNNPNGDLPNPTDLPNDWSEGKDYAIFQTSQDSLDNIRFHDKIKAIAMVSNSKLEINYGVVLHNLPGPLMKNKGWARIYLPGDSSFPDGTGCTYKTEGVGDSPIGITMCGPFDQDYSGSFHGNMDDVSSVTIFAVAKQGSSPSHSIKICREDRCIKKDIGGTLHDANIRFNPSSDFTNITSDFGGSALHMGGNVLSYINLATTTWDTGEEIDHDGGSTGISSIEINEGATYLVLLYSEPLNNITNINTNTKKSYIQTAIINHSATSLKTIDWDDVTAMIVVINTLSAADN